MKIGPFYGWFGKTDRLRIGALCDWTSFGAGVDISRECDEDSPPQVWYTLWVQVGFANLLVCWRVA